MSVIANIVIYGGAGKSEWEAGPPRRTEPYADIIGRITAPVIRRDVHLVHRPDMSRAAVEVVVLAVEVLEAMVKDRTWPASLKSRARDIRKRL